MTLDSSALVAILFEEAGYLELVDRILRADQVRVSAPTVVETSVVVTGRRRSRASAHVQTLLKELDVQIVPFGQTEWTIAVDAFHRFGRGRHPAALNFGDCLAYAAAAAAGDVLLFVGDDFAPTPTSRLLDRLRVVRRQADRDPA